MQTMLMQNRNLIIRELDGDVFILDERDKRIHHLNITASAIWRFLETPARANDVIAIFRHLYPDADQRQLKKSIRQSLAWMRRKDILHSRRQ
tara:strand:+ start:1828 stop:2103 length:276 start_codon:yes stop_codon:yes gene_type:complete